MKNRFHVPLTAKQYLWLMTQGDRTAEDVFVYGGKLFIYMDDQMCFIPRDRFIKIYKKSSNSVTVRVS